MKKIILISILILLPSLAFAHPGHGLESLKAGFMHPLTGWDHLLVMLAIGVWASKIGGQARWQLPLTFVSVMAIGAILGLANVTFLGVETLIAASVMAMGVLIALHLKISMVSCIALVALFAIVHGFAHGVELDTHQSIAVLLGMLLATALLHGLGLILGAQRVQIAQRLHTVFAWLLMLVGGYLMIA